MGPVHPPRLCTLHAARRDGVLRVAEHAQCGEQRAWGNLSPTAANDFIMIVYSSPAVTPCELITAIKCSIFSPKVVSPNVKYVHERPDIEHACVPPVVIWKSKS
jgi:hypothetical protein